MKEVKGNSTLAMAEQGGRDVKYRQFTGWMDKLVKGVSIFFVLYTVIFILGGFELIGFYIVAPKHAALHLASILFLCFLLVPATKNAPRNRLPWYDALFALLAIPWNLYLFFFYDTLLIQLSRGFIPLWNQVFIWFTILLTLEAGRRTLGPYFSGIVAFFIIYALSASHFPSFLRGASALPSQLVRYVGMWEDGLYGPILWISSTIIVSFILFGNVLNSTGGGNFVTNTALAIVGRVTGGPAKVAVIASGAFGTMSGSSAANAATTGVITIPLMKKTGYRPEFAGAVEAVASTGGGLMPPIMGSVIFVMCQMLGITYIKAVISSILPALLYYGAVFVMVDLEARRTGLSGIDQTQGIPSLKHTLANGWLYLIPLLSLVITLFILFYSPQKSAIYSILILLFFLLLIKRDQLNRRTLLNTLEGTISAMLVVAPCCALAGIIGGCIGVTGLGLRITGGLIDVSGGNLAILLILTALFAIILGMGVPVVATYFTVGILIAPALIEMGIIPIAAHLFVIWFAQASMITPPVAPTVYLTAAIAQSGMWRTGLISCRLGIVIFCAPFIFAYYPALLLTGSLVESLIIIATSLVGITAVSIALQGYFLKGLTWLQRIIFFVGGGLLIIPTWMSSSIGFTILVIAVLTLYLQQRRKNVLMENKL